MFKVKTALPEGNPRLLKSESLQCGATLPLPLTTKLWLYSPKAAFLGLHYTSSILLTFLQTVA